jgi:hypothetical protein
MAADPREAINRALAARSPGGVAQMLETVAQDAIDLML